MDTGTAEYYGPKLSDFFAPEEIQALRAEMVSSSEGVPVRFLYNGQNLEIQSGRLMKKGVNVIHQIFYWNFTRTTANKIATTLKVRAVFSE